MPEGRGGVELVQQSFMVDAVETFGNIGVQHEFRLAVQAVPNSYNRIMGGTSWSKPIAVRLELSFPRGFQCEQQQCLGGAVVHRRNTEGSLLIRTGFGNPDPSGGLRFTGQPDGAHQC